jgi:hypothetical protein
VGTNVESLFSVLSFVMANRKRWGQNKNIVFASRRTQHSLFCWNLT